MDVTPKSRAEPRDLSRSARSAQIGFQNRSTQRVFRIHHISKTNTTALGKKHVGVEFLETEIGGHPADQFAISDTGSILHRSTGTDRHKELLVFQAWPFERPLLDQVDLHGGNGRMLERHAAQFAVALDGMAIAEIQ